MRVLTDSRLASALISASRASLSARRLSAKRIAGSSSSSSSLSSSESSSLAPVFALLALLSSSFGWSHHFSFFVDFVVSRPKSLSRISRAMAFFPSDCACSPPPTSVHRPRSSSSPAPMTPASSSLSGASAARVASRTTVPSNFFTGSANGRSSTGSAALRAFSISSAFLFTAKARACFASTSSPSSASSARFARLPLAFSSAAKRPDDRKLAYAAFLRTKFTSSSDISSLSLSLSFAPASRAAGAGARAFASPRLVVVAPPRPPLGARRRGCLDGIARAMRSRRRTRACVRLTGALRRRERR
mmetsp:Transcript_8807/g.28950  ORF Transcript_8807/g.28950 Transcript_8807/m.28950 type:complete len:303 (+) Transcript_8807:1720-2628(+)